MALCVAAAALEGRRRLENVPQRPSASFAAGGEVVESDDELVALVADVRGTITIRCGLHHNLLSSFYLAFIGVQDLGKEKNFIKDLLREIVLAVCERRESGQKEKVLAHYLEYPWNFFGICTVYISMSNRSDMKQLTVGGRHGRFSCGYRVIWVIKAI